MSGRLRLLALLGLGVIGIGCEQLPEEIIVINDTPAKVEVVYFEHAQGPNARHTAAPGETVRYAQRPIALHGEDWFANIDDEEQFAHIMRAGVVFIDEKGHRVHLDVKALRAQMTYAPPRVFTMHIRPELFAAAP